MNEVKKRKGKKKEKKRKKRKKERKKEKERTLVTAMHGVLYGTLQELHWNTWRHCFNVGAPQARCSSLS